MWKVHPVTDWSLSFFGRGVMGSLWEATTWGCIKFPAMLVSMNVERGMVSSCRQTGMWNDSVDLDNNVETIVDSQGSYFTHVAVGSVCHGLSRIDNPRQCI